MLIFKRLSFIQALAAAWNAYRINARFFLTASVVVLFIIIALRLAFGFPLVFTLEKIPSPWSVYTVLDFLLHELYVYQLLYYSKRIYEGETPLWQSFFTIPSGNFILFLLARLRYSIIIGLGLILFIIPGVFYACSNFFAGYSITFSLTDSIKKDALMSSTITKHNRLRILLLLTIDLLFAFGPSFILPFIIPFIVLVNIDAYKQLMEPYKETTTVL